MQIDFQPVAQIADITAVSLGGAPVDGIPGAGGAGGVLGVIGAQDFPGDFPRLAGAGCGDGLGLGGGLRGFPLFSFIIIYGLTVNIHWHFAHCLTVIFVLFVHGLTVDSFARCRL
jgi:hypothetical protein